MSRARIVNGIRMGNVSVRWKQASGWRTAITKNTLADPRLRECHFVLGGETRAEIPVEELRRVVVGGPDYGQGRTHWGPFNIDPEHGTVAGQTVLMRVVRNDDEALKDSPEMAILKQELDELQSQPQTPETLQKIQRVVKRYERSRSIRLYVKRTRKPVATCQLCRVPGFRMKNGNSYCEVHHLFHLSKNPPPKCLAPEYLVVLCATCHARMHHADVGEPVRDGMGWRIRVDGVEHRFETGQPSRQSSRCN